MGVLGPGAGLASAIGIGALSGGLASAAGQVVSNVTSGKSWNSGVLEAGITGAVIGGVTGGLLRAAAPLLTKVGNAAKNAFRTEENGVINGLQDAAKACGGLSFAPTTKVATRQGEQAIGTLKVGQQVWSYNPKTKKMELKPILHVWINHDNDLVDLTITKSAHRKGTMPTSEVVHTNQKHPFLTIEKGFLPVGQMKLGMHVVEANGHVGVISGWKVVPGVQIMYNLEVAQDHTFVVGMGQWVVHNCARSGSSGNSGAAQLGNQFHYDMQGGGPAQLQQMYPTTQFEFTPRGPAGADVHVIGGDHPSNTSVYPGSTWSAGSDYGDFKPNSWNTPSRSRFQREINSGKLPAGTVPIWYDPIAYVILGIG